MALRAVNNGITPPVPINPFLSAAPFRFDLGIGGEFLDDKMYYSIQAGPQFKAGIFRMGLDLKFRFGLDQKTGSFYIYEKDWYLKDGSILDYLSLYMSKIRYLRVGSPEDKAYLDMGTLTDVSLGSGLLLEGYSNGMFLPERSRFGFRLKLDGKLFKIPYFGLDILASDIGRWDFFGGRFFVRPFASVPVKSVSDLEIGTTLLFDTRPFAFLKDENSDGLYDGTLLPVKTRSDPVILLGTDIREPLVATKLFDVDLFTELGLQIVPLRPEEMRNLNYTVPAGWTAGIRSRLFFLTLKGKINVFGKNFIDRYFDSEYDLDKGRKYQIISFQTPDPLPFRAGYEVAAGTEFFDQQLVLNISLSGSFKKISAPLDLVTGTNIYEYPALTAVFYMNRGLVPWFDFAFWYLKKGIDSFQSLLNPSNASIGGIVNFRINNTAVISGGVRVRYLPDFPGGWNVDLALSAGLEF